ncbi:MAG TPA: alpha/beta hydrolase [Devosia sp.]|nr:alpha/beta hydrolase [Devosia sp.]
MSVLPMPRQRKIPPDYPAFAPLPVQMVTLGDGRLQAAVHVSGVLTSKRMPVVCIPGYQRNMSDFSEFAAYFQRVGGGQWPLVLIDLPGRGRSSDRVRVQEYGSQRDARAVANVLAALGLERATFIGQGYGGQVAMALATAHPLLLAGVVLLDASPVTDSRGIVRLRNNLNHLESLRGSQAVRAGFHKMLLGDYPGSSESQLDALMLRSHRLDRRGRAWPLHDPRLITALEAFSFDDVLAAQWPMFDTLAATPLMLARTQLTDQVRRETFDEMMRRRPDAVALTIAGQGSPALFDQHQEIDAVAAFAIAVSTKTLGKTA